MVCAVGGGWTLLRWLVGVPSSADGGWDLFVSYTPVDRPWVVWVAWVLEEVEFRVLIQKWDL